MLIEMVDVSHAQNFKSKHLMEFHVWIEKSVHKDNIETNTLINVSIVHHILFLTRMVEIAYIQSVILTWSLVKLVSVFTVELAQNQLETDVRSKFVTTDQSC